MPHEPQLPQKYNELSDQELAEQIFARKGQLADKLCLLAHHYQRDEIVQFADYRGDSLKLSQLAASQNDAKYIVFCGVHFMAESADILSADDKIVCLPHMQAGCAMADMADDGAVAAAIDELSAMSDEKLVPVTYVNSTAAIKAITASAGGACCTSSNVENVFRWALDEAGAGGEKILAIPDQHLGRNTAISLGYDLDDTAVYDPSLPNGGLSADDVKRTKFILWKGHCYVHQRFTSQHVISMRERFSDIRIIVHPECPREVVSLADASGSTEQIIRTIEAAPAGSSWAIGTESNLVNRLARKHSDLSIRVLSDSPALCAQMGRIDMPHLLWVLDNLAEGKIINQVSVAKNIAAQARISLQRMIDIKATP